MLAVVVAAGLFPNTGTVHAQSSCPYGGCSTPSSAIASWELVSILVLIAAIVVAAALVLMRRRRPPAPAGPPQPWQEGPPAGAGAVVAAPPGAPPPYIEGPEDVGHAPPPLATPAAKAVAPAAPAAAPAAAPEGADIDSLMAELDKISSEILKKPPKKGAESTTGEEAEDAGKSP